MFMCYQNILLASEKSTEAAIQTGLVFRSLIVPLFFVIAFELPFRLHEARSVHFCCIPFEVILVYIFLLIAEKLYLLI